MRWYHQLRTWTWKTSDRAALWWHGLFGVDPKQRALEWRMDNIPNKRLAEDIDRALNINSSMGNERKKHRKEKKKPKKPK